MDTGAGTGGSRPVAHGAMWAAASNIFLRVAGIGLTILLARVLDPSDFGVFAIALAVHTVVSSLADLGLAAAISRSPHDPEELAPSATAIAWGSGLLLTVAMWVAAGPVSAFVRVPEAAGSIRILALTLLLTGLLAVPSAQLTREFRQDMIFRSTVAGFVVSSIVLLVIVSRGGGAEAFAWSRVAGMVASGIVVVRCVGRHYWPGWNGTQARALLRFGAPLMAANMVNLVLLNADYLVIGRRLDETSVGVYMIAFSVAGWSTAVLGSVLNGVVVPAFGRVAHDRGLVRAQVATSVQLVALIALPVGAVTTVLAGPIIGTLFGAEWARSVAVLSVLAAYGAVYAFVLLLTNVVIALGQTARLLTIQVAWVCTVVPLLVVCVEAFGIVGAGFAHVAAISVVVLPAYLRLLLRTTDVRLRDLLAATARPAVGAAGAAGAAAMVVGVMDRGPVTSLILGGAAAVLVYAAVVAPVARRQVRRLGRQRSSGTDAPEQNDPTGQVDALEGAS